MVEKNDRQCVVCQSKKIAILRSNVVGQTHENPNHPSKPKMQKTASSNTTQIHFTHFVKMEENIFGTSDGCAFEIQCLPHSFANICLELMESRLASSARSKRKNHFFLPSVDEQSSKMVLLVGMEKLHLVKKTIAPFLCPPAFACLCQIRTSHKSTQTPCYCNGSFKIRKHISVHHSNRVF